MAEADPRGMFDVKDAATDLSQLMDRARAGEEIILAKGGEAWVKLVGVEPVVKRKRTPGGWPELAAIPDSVWTDPLPEEDLAFIDDRPPAERR